MPQEGERLILLFNKGHLCARRGERHQHGRTGMRGPRRSSPRPGKPSARLGNRKVPEKEPRRDVRKRGDFQPDAVSFFFFPFGGLTHDFFNTWGWKYGVKNSKLAGARLRRIIVSN